MKICLSLKEVADSLSLSPATVQKLVREKSFLNRGYYRAAEWDGSHTRSGSGLTLVRFLTFCRRRIRALQGGKFPKASGPLREPFASWRRSSRHRCGSDRDDTQTHRCKTNLENVSVPDGWWC